LILKLLILFVYQIKQVFVDYLLSKPFLLESVLKFRRVLEIKMMSDQ